jgi:putative transposase
MRSRPAFARNPSSHDAIEPKRKTSRPAAQHRIYPYLLRGLAIDRPNQVCAADITYIPMARGFLDLIAVIDWYSRYVLAWRLSTRWTLPSASRRSKTLCGRGGRPEIFNTDQGTQLTSAAFTDRLETAGVRISMDGPRALVGNVFVERLRRSLK